MIQHINLSVCEHAEKRLTLTRKAGKEFTESTGEREVTRYTGPWSEVLEFGCAAASGREGAVAVTVEIERREGNIGEMTITEERYRKPDEEEDGGSGGGGGDIGTSSNPEVTCNFSVQAEPLLGHPNFKGVTESDAWLLQQVASGMHPDARVEYGGKSVRLKKACEQLKGAAKEALGYYLRGITQYYEVCGDVTVRGTGGEFPGEVGRVASPPGGVQAPEGRNWMCTGKGKLKRGKEVEYTAQYRMSGAGGWDEGLYK